MSCVPPPDSGDDVGEKTAVLHGDQETLNKELQRAKEQEACLIIIRGTPQGHRFFLTAPEMILGRDPSADVSIVDQGISRKHARVARVGEKVVIEDLGSSNGTFVNDQKLEPGKKLELNKEDMIKMGASILKFLPAGELEILFYGALGAAAHQDELTKIYNRAFLNEALAAEFKRARALHTDFSILFFDLDHFKKVNDTHGHDAGDYVLREFTNVVKMKFLRPKDIFARVGGEEFILLLANTAATAAQVIAEKIRAAVEAHSFVYDGKKIPVTTSMGVAELTATIESPQALMKTADKALYAAKTGGRNKVVVAT